MICLQILYDNYPQANLKVMVITEAISNLPYSIMHVEPNEKVDIRTFLRCSLKKVCACEGPEILEQCLDAVLPICNSPETKAFMEDYCKQASDEGRYELKINAFKNTTLPGFGTLTGKVQFKPQVSISYRNYPTSLPFFSHSNASACGIGYF
ncbi:uncharacterized protein LACBIDRAFT_336169 [Laccaria bicolor S238N-H82]|uniref:Predicted protein n=1 Tax=Laccaria bicolor (strain S238N-H82 / ATCC MYA-4686) TaxID=486041 RepID=B0E4L5_LACBS|nr:uncharacterized protein LACBIDRAFT_336169 [Laccaria bicolor S238N-H82]EDQ98214.1 predicted protein [Laccaria bicolor S238N-H82]|eukprot:XP_001891132.1 predicted protein [Laccaria bicolor S238N-H82]